MTDLAAAIAVLNTALAKLGSYRMTVDRAKTVRIEQIIATDAAHLIDEGAVLGPIPERGKGPIDEALTRLRKVMFETGEGFNLQASDLAGLTGRAYLGLLAGRPGPGSAPVSPAALSAEDRARLEGAVSAIQMVLAKLR